MHRENVMSLVRRAQFAIRIIIKTLISFRGAAVWIAVGFKSKFSIVLHILMSYFNLKRELQTPKLCFLFFNCKITELNTLAFQPKLEYVQIKFISPKYLYILVQSWEINTAFWLLLVDFIVLKGNPLKLETKILTF